MNNILKIRNPNDYSRYLGQLEPVRHSLNNYSVYGIFFHDEAEVDLSYGCGKYDYKKGKVICVAPGQIGGLERQR